MTQVRRRRTKNGIPFVGSAKTFNNVEASSTERYEMTDEGVSSLTPEIDKLSDTVRDIRVNYSMATEKDRKRLRGIAGSILSMQDEESFGALFDQLKDDDFPDSPEEADQMIDDVQTRSEDAKPSKDRGSLIENSYLDSPILVGGSKVRPSNTGQNDYGFGIGGQHLP